MKLDKVREPFLEAIRNGLSIEKACIFAGIAEKTYYNWRDKAKEQISGQYSSFIQAIKKAEAEAISTKLTAIQKAIEGGYEAIDTEEVFNANGELIRRIVKTHKAPPNWTAAAWYLERKLPSEWGRRLALPISELDKPKEPLVIRFVRDSKSGSNTAPE